jgi:hypothetical protein
MVQEKVEVEDTVTTWGVAVALGVPLCEALALGAVDTVARLREGDAVPVRAVGSEGDAVVEGERLRVAHAVASADSEMLGLAVRDGEGV